VTEKGLLDSGYETMTEDVPLLGKQIGDTLIYYQLYEKYDSLSKQYTTSVTHRFCYIHLVSADSSALQKLVSTYDADIVSDFMHINEFGDPALHSTVGFHGTFFVEHRFTKQIFKCYVGKASGSIDNKQSGFELSITTYFPWTEEQIKESGWVYNSVYE
jgi:hypothetical protein